MLLARDVWKHHQNLEFNCSTTARVSSLFACRLGLYKHRPLPSIVSTACTVSSSIAALERGATDTHGISLGLTSQQTEKGLRLG